MPGSICETYKKIKDNISKVIVGKDETIDLLIITLFCRGHMLIEDVPGTGKTMLVKALASSVDAECGRIQFTPDLLPSDITGINFFNMKKSEFEFLKGPVFANLVIADEINRATPKTQSALLEAMQEGQVTVDGKSRFLPTPFMVVATQNPIESSGVFPLPEAELDRFMTKCEMKYPTATESAEILTRYKSDNPILSIKSVVGISDIEAAQSELEKIFVHPDIIKYIVAVNDATRGADGVILGSSPRGALALLAVSRGYAAISGRSYVTPDDVKRAAPYVLSHRLLLNNSARIKKDYAKSVINDILLNTPVPTEKVFEA